ncbi:putative THAP domain-containing protein [Danaus plexippus plexippus]|uniref:THAP domain-containing protein n=1 Tax=Danaus plexippus plexippus TaxID=278856 RepID=A0A212FD12_DANPL|nr:THAP domain-containing protein 1-like [Danaus plexippus plexippus]OWR51636.1 putative THAP domain-containing protein [Danaus plexippus plexippus]
MSFSQGLIKIKENEDCRSKSILIAKVAPELKQNTEADTEITKTCAVLGCEESKNFNSDSFFRFPEDPSLRQIWADLTGRNNWTPTDYSYICVQHFSVDCFECNADNAVVLVNKAVPSLKLPKHVLEVEYIDEETLDNEYEEEEIDEPEENHESNVKRLTNGSLNTDAHRTEDNYEVLKLFTEVQKMQRQAVYLSEKLKSSMKIYKRQSRFLMRLKEAIETKRHLLNQKRKKKSRILLSLQDKIKEDTNGLVLAMPTRHTDDLKNFSLSVYKYSPQAYIYIRNTLRTLLPSTDVLDSWLSSGYEPKNVMSSNNLIKVISELTDSELSCKVTLR